MLVPLNWLREYTNINNDIEKITEKFTMSGLKVESYKKLGEEINNVVIGKILSIKKHPEADKLVVCMVDTGDEVLQIITGATNVYEGAVVPVAKVGATLPGGIKIRKQKLRGMESFGMLCSAEELGIDEEYVSAESRNGIYLLPELTIGQDAKSALGLDDTVIDFEITHNRSDCLSIIGIAREASAIFDEKLTIPDISVDEIDEYAKDRINIDVVADDLCSRYTARIVKDIKIEPSPEWMQQKLIKAGIRPVNNIVDVTNYVMIEIGQPLHAFDLDKVIGKNIYVRRADEGETIETIDHKKRVLDNETLVIADSVKPIAIAGVMGGTNTEIDENTHTILIESANFSGINIRRTSRRLGLRSEASGRYERGIDPNITKTAADRAAQLIQQMNAGKVLRGVVDVYKNVVTPKKIQVLPSRINSLLGTNLKDVEIRDILKKLNLKCELSEKLEITVPTYRQDIKLDADIAEEVARIYGYDNIQETYLSSELTQAACKTHEQKIEDNIRDIMCACGLNEIITYSFGSPKALDKINVPADDKRRQQVRISNPLGEDYSVMRTTLIPSMLDVLAYNNARRVEKVGAFEMGRIYIPKELPIKNLPLEQRILCIGMYGDTDFYDIKGCVETLLNEFGISARYILSDDKTFHPGRTAKIMLDDKVLGIVGEIHPDVAVNYEIDKKVYIAELNIDDIILNEKIDKSYRALPKYPAITRDLAVVVKDDILSMDIQDIIKQNGGSLIERVKFFDVYKGAPIMEGYKSMAYSVVFRSNDRTLTDDEVNNVFKNIVNALEGKLGAKLR